MPKIKQHEITTLIMSIKGPFNKLKFTPDRLFLTAYGVDYGEGPKNLYFINHCTN